MTTSVFWASDSEQYAGFWSRFGAQLIDFLVVLPFAAIRMLFFQSRLAATFEFIPGILFEFWFFVYLVYRYGGTPGKLAVGIRITSANGERIAFRQALLRHAPSLVFSGISAVVVATALSQVSDGMYAATPWLQRTRLISVFAPHWFRYVSVVITLWTWSELAVMLTNPEKRALHDFLAGTVVIKREYFSAGDTAPSQSPAFSDAILKS